jgi:hypothetical protein
VRGSSVVEHLAHNQTVAGSIPAPATKHRSVAQLEEPSTDNREVTSSTLVAPTNARVAQLGRAPALQAGCWRFDPVLGHQLADVIVISFSG